MRFLLDTHVWLWLVSRPESLQNECLTQLARPDAEIFLSVASAWEIGIKYAMGKLDLPEPPEKYIPSRLTRDRVAVIPIELPHAMKASSLPLLHRDPFDRLMVAQAQLLGLNLVTRDPMIQQYEVNWILA